VEPLVPKEYLDARIKIPGGKSKKWTRGGASFYLGVGAEKRIRGGGLQKEPERRKDAGHMD